MFKILRAQRAKSVAGLCAALEIIKIQNDGALIGFTLGMLWALFHHTMSALVHTFMTFVQAPLLILKWLVLTPLIMLYVWTDGVILIVWFYLQALKNRE